MSSIKRRDRGNLGPKLTRTFDRPIDRSLGGGENSHLGRESFSAPKHGDGGRVYSTLGRPPARPFARARAIKYRVTTEQLVDYLFLAQLWNVLLVGGQLLQLPFCPVG